MKFENILKAIDGEIEKRKSGNYGGPCIFCEFYGDVSGFGNNCIEECQICILSWFHSQGAMLGCIRTKYMLGITPFNVIEALQDLRQIVIDNEIEA